MLEQNLVLLDVGKNCLSRVDEAALSPLHLLKVTTCLLGHGSALHD
jgi:hypothetical protein